MQLTSQEFMNLLGKRAGYYSFLSQSFLEEPSHAFLQELGTQLHVFKEDAKFHQGAELLTDYFREWKTESTVKQKELAKEFAYLFLAPGEHHVHPYESVHRCPNRLLKGQPYDEIVREFREMGLGVRQECRELEDHIALEMEFMEVLCGETIQACEEGDKTRVASLLDKQQTFLRKHLLKWVPQFCKRICEEAKSSFFKGIAMMTEAFVLEEREQVRFLRNHCEFLWSCGIDITQVSPIAGELCKKR
jgi:TorA maturation chaperone TorD